MPPEHSNGSKETVSRFEKLRVVLTHDGFDYSVAGGVAVILNGCLRVTVAPGMPFYDVPENIQRLLPVKPTGSGYPRWIRRCWARKRSRRAHPNKPVARTSPVNGGSGM